MSQLRHRGSSSEPTASAKVGALSDSWSELAPWRRDNEHIWTGYRITDPTWKGCFGSIFVLHNETINIHSHLWGFLWFCWLLLTFSTDHIYAYPSATWQDTAVFAIFLSSAAVCLGASALFHTCTCHSPKVSAACHRADYCGIVTLICGSFYPCVYYAFYCQPALQVAYLSAITLVSLAAAKVVLDPQMALPSHRGTRTKVFIILGLSAVAPVTHVLIAHGLQAAVEKMGLGWLIASGALYIIGALMYANRIPEKIWPGQFDLFGASHQIFHICVVLAGLAHYRCVIVAFQHWHSVENLCPLR